jgi:hypothetical protein
MADHDQNIQNENWDMDLVTPRHETGVCQIHRDISSPVNIALLYTSCAQKPTPPSGEENKFFWGWLKSEFYLMVIATLAPCLRAALH